jgi:hypothetical protein
MGAVVAEVVVVVQDIDGHCVLLRVKKNPQPTQ